MIFLIEKNLLSLIQKQFASKNKSEKSIATLAAIENKTRRFPWTTIALTTTQKIFSNSLKAMKKQANRKQNGTK